jgi:hypothetical protein
MEQADGVTVFAIHTHQFHTKNGHNRLMRTCSCSAGLRLLMLPVEGGSPRSVWHDGAEEHGWGRAVPDNTMS